MSAKHTYHKKYMDHYIRESEVIPRVVSVPCTQLGSFSSVSYVTTITVGD